MPEHASRQDLTPGIRQESSSPRQGTAGTRQPTRPYAGDTPPVIAAPPRNCRKNASRRDLTPGIRQDSSSPRQGTAGTRQPTRPYAGDTPPVIAAPPRNCRKNASRRDLTPGIRRRLLGIGRDSSWPCQGQVCIPQSKRALFRRAKTKPNVILTTHSTNLTKKINEPHCISLLNPT
jgi:hypothetical protein